MFKNNKTKCNHNEELCGDRVWVGHTSFTTAAAAAAAPLETLLVPPAAAAHFWRIKLIVLSFRVPLPSSLLSAAEHNTAIKCDCNIISSYVVHHTPHVREIVHVVPGQWVCSATVY